MAIGDIGREERFIYMFYSRREDQVAVHEAILRNKFQRIEILARFPASNVYPQHWIPFGRKYHISSPKFHE